MRNKSKHSKKKITPTDNLGFSPQLTVTGNREAILEGCRKIKEYDDGKLTFSMGNLNVCFCGNNLIIKNYGEDFAVICGEFSDISFG
ncbi:MAG: YabP/YqfC family sporulation protein [Oscillospiraceae bacterium]|nr:YabP/YqfC family sporulation protein [Oscillospiraceae bacterium]